ncbi:hypothetical protein Fmac_016523 [Flemingia macrophylla]|uniref:glucan endo-1,3-beta-D-glucosidase n=1 Tax=Flemingia macrophylla TaxID=520843 RepID=A0ABD1MHL3_9FABA
MEAIYSTKSFNRILPLLFRVFFSLPSSRYNENQPKPHSLHLPRGSFDCVLPDPSNIFSPHLLSSPLPTNSFFQNFTLNNGDQPEYIHPYLIKSSNSSLSLSYPSRKVSSSEISQVFNADLTITSQQASSGKHVISSYSDLSVTLDIPSRNLSFFLVRGSPYLTFSATKPSLLSITTIHSLVSFSSNDSLTKFTMKFHNGQTWLLYASSPINFSTIHSGKTLPQITSNGFSGTIRIALLPESDSKLETVLDKFSLCYPVSGKAVFREPFCVEYHWETNGVGDLLMLAHPLHLQLLCNEDSHVTVLDDFKYKSIDGGLVGVVASNSWVLKADPVFVTWHSSKGIPKAKARDEIMSALRKDVDYLNSSSITTNESYFYGKLIARAARLALIAEEVCCLDVIPEVRLYLKETIVPWLEGTFYGNGFLYDNKWGGIMTEQGSSNNANVDHGFGVYNDHHYNLGYFIYGIAVLTKLDPAWGMNYKAQAYSLVQDYMNLGTNSNLNYTRLRCFDPYLLHSWAGGLTVFRDGRSQQNTSEAVNAYYSAALLGLVYGDANLVTLGSTLTALEILGAKMWWHVEEGGDMYEKEFGEGNRIVGVLWSNKRDSRLWFTSAERRECRLGIHVLPLLPISEVLFSNVEYVKQLVDWTLPALNRHDVCDGWKGFIYALEGIYDNECALRKIKRLKDFDDGNSLTNLLWWVHSRGD